MTLIRKIISGGQTGADRGGLDAAIHFGIDWGGWVPRGFRSEDGRIPEKYRRNLVEAVSSNYQERTRLNIRDSDCTLVFGKLGHIGPGSWLTIETAKKLGKPCAFLDVDVIMPPYQQTRAIRDFIISASGWDFWSHNDGAIVNVAGSRESKIPGIQKEVYMLLMMAMGVGPLRTEGETK